MDCPYLQTHRAGFASGRRISVFLALLLLGLGSVIVGCQQNGRVQTATRLGNGEVKSSTPSAYALLFDLLGDEADVSKLRFIKREPAALSNLTKEIAAACRAAHKKLEDFGRSDPSLNLKNTMLPADELATRKAISKTKTSALLKNKGAEFEIQLLLSQHEAMVYGQHLALIAARSENQAERKQFLASLSLELDHLQAKILELLKSQYTSLKPKT